jgi:hypothetical protein
MDVRGADREHAAAPLLSFRCAECGYGARRRSAPHRCPMCGGTEWEEEGWSSFPVHGRLGHAQDASEPDSSPDAAIGV